MNIHAFPDYGKRVLSLPLILGTAVAVAGQTGGSMPGGCTSAGQHCDGKNVLPEVTVTEEQFPAGGGSNISVLKTDVAIQELPLTVETIGAGIIDRTRLANMDTLLSVHTLGSLAPADGGLFNEFALRGFTDVSFYRNGLNDSLGSPPVRELANIESIEILKGPVSALYGPGEPGGSVNFITKQPQRESRHRLRLGYGSYDRLRVEIDATGPLPLPGETAYRLVAAIDDSESFRDSIQSNRKFISPSLAFAITDRLSVIGSAEILRHRTPFDSGVIFLDGTLPLGQSTFLGEPDHEDNRLQSFTSYLDFDYTFDDGWDMSLNLQWQNTDISGLRVEPDGIDEDSRAPGFALLSREIQRESDDADGFTAQIEANGRFIWQGLENRLLAGYEYTATDNRVSINASDTDLDPFAINIFAISYGQPLPVVTPLLRSREELEQHSLYLQDFVRLGDNWRLLAGTRMDAIRINGRDLVSGLDFRTRDTEFSSRVGLVFRPVDKVSLFASFSESFDPNEGLKPDGTPLDVTRGRSFEGGFKYLDSGRKLSLDVSAFHIELKNVATEAPNNPGFEIQTAKQVSTGLDIDLSYKPVEWFYGSIKYGFANAEIRNDAEVPDGTAPLNSPLHKLIISGLLSFSLRSENDLQTGITFQYNSREQASLDPDELVERIPSYWLGNLYLDYAWSENIVLGLNVSNILDEKYYEGSQADLLSITPGAPASVFATVEFRFH